MQMLRRIASLINEDIPKQLEKSPALKERFIAMALTRRGQPLAHMDHEFLELITNSISEERVRVAVKSCQYSIIALLGKLMQWLPEDEFSRMNSLDPDNDRYYLFKFLHQLLYDLHVYVEDNFYRYMDHDCKVPAYGRFLFREFIIKALVTIKCSPRFRSLDNRLQHILAGPLETSLSTSHDVHLTYAGKKYTEALADQLLEFVKRDTDNTWDLYSRLQLIDFNSIEYVRYLTSQFGQECLPFLDHKEKYLWLLERRKKIAHQLVKDDMSFNPGQKSLKAMLDEWIEWEIYYVTRLMALEITSK